MSDDRPPLDRRSRRDHAALVDARAACRRRRARREHRRRRAPAHRHRASRHERPLPADVGPSWGDAPASVRREAPVRRSDQPRDRRRAAVLPEGGRILPPGGRDGRHPHAALLARGHRRRRRGVLPRHGGRDPGRPGRPADRLRVEQAASLSTSSPSCTRRAGAIPRSRVFRFSPIPRPTRRDLAALCMRCWPGFRERYAARLAPELLAVAERSRRASARGWSAPRGRSRSSTATIGSTTCFSAPLAGGRRSPWSTGRRWRGASAPATPRISLAPVSLVEDRRAHEQRAAPRLLGALRARGVADYPFERAGATIGGPRSAAS